MEPEFGGADAVNHAEFDGDVGVDFAVGFDDAVGFEVATQEIVEIEAVPAFGSASEELDIDGSLLDAIEQELAEVERALALIDEGTYGQCEACGGSIDDAVLERTPTSRFCAEHLPLSLR